MSNEHEEGASMGAPEIKSELQYEEIEPAEVKANDPDSLYTGRPNYWAKRQMQSGIEKKHEAWVMETLNFLQSNDIPFYSYHANGNRDPKRDKDIPERLNLVQEKIHTLQKDARDARLSMYEAQDLRRKSNELLITAEDMLELVHQVFEPVDAHIGTEADGVLVKLRAMLENRRPHLFEEEETEEEETEDGTDETHSLCKTCGLLTKEGQHSHTTYCIQAMRVAMVKQKQAAETLGMDMSVHFLRALEELSIRPDVGFRYTTWDHAENRQVEVPAQQVSGVFASLLKAYREQANFEDEDHQRRVSAHWSMIAGKIGGMLNLFMEKYEVDEDEKIEAMALLESVAHDDGTGPSVAELKEEIQGLRDEGLRMLALLIQVEKQGFRTGTMTSEAFDYELAAILHPEQQEERPPDPGCSESPQS